MARICKKFRQIHTILNIFFRIQNSNRGFRIFFIFFSSGVTLLAEWSWSLCQSSGSFATPRTAALMGHTFRGKLLFGPSISWVAWPASTYFVFSSISQPIRSIKQSSVRSLTGWVTDNSIITECFRTVEFTLCVCWYTVQQTD